MTQRFMPATVLRWTSANIRRWRRVGLYPIKRVLNERNFDGHEPALFWVIGWDGWTPDWILAHVVAAYDAGRTIAVLALNEVSFENSVEQLARIAGGFQ